MTDAEGERILSVLEKQHNHLVDMLGMLRELLVLQRSMADQLTAEKIVAAVLNAPLRS